MVLVRTNQHEWNSKSFIKTGFHAYMQTLIVKVGYGKGKTGGIIFRCIHI